MIHVFFGTCITVVTFRNAGSCHRNRHTNLNSMSVALFRFFVDRNWNSSYYGNLLHIRFRNWKISLDFYFVEVWFLNMMNIILLVIFLNNRLCDCFFSRNCDFLQLFNIENLTVQCDWVQLNLSIFSLSDL